MTGFSLIIGEFYQKMWTDISIVVNKQKYGHFARRPIHISVLCVCVCVCVCVLSLVLKEHLPTHDKHHHGTTCYYKPAPV